MNHYSFSPIERQATLAIAGVFALRMLGLFMILPLFSLYATHLQNTTPFLMGFALGCYGLTQAVLQIPFGLMSDRYDRKLIIAIGLILFILGSLLAAMSHSIYTMIAARALQGAGAVGSATLALLSDFTREQQRTKAMAIVGATIGLSFTLAILLGPLLNQWLDVPGLFGITALFGLGAIILLWGYVPPAPSGYTTSKNKQPSWQQLKTVLRNSDLIRLNFGILTLHTVFTASFIAIPILLKESGHLDAHRQWLIYLPTLLAACLVILPLMMIYEKKGQNRPLFLNAILLLAISQISFLPPSPSLLRLGTGLFVFFMAFTLLEALLPSWVSKMAPVQNRGAALGLYSCFQFLGISLGGIIGGWLYGHYTPTGLFCFSTLLVLLWFILAKQMTELEYAVKSQSGT